MIIKTFSHLRLYCQRLTFCKSILSSVIFRSSVLKASSRSTMASTSIKQQFDSITKSEEDKRLYRGLELNNGMKMLLISDPTTDKSSAAMDVHIGHMSNPENLPGLAHFCEHMLFLGTEKYPEENEYNKFLNEHGGSSNAFTSEEHTNYYFDVSPDHLPGALDRFAQFFYQPLFTASATDREVNAVNSENDKNLQNDSWRLFQLEKATCDSEHPYSKFGTGNKATLDTIPKEKGIDVRAELLKFHDELYSSNLMGLCVLGKESLDELTELVVPLFTNVENKNHSMPEWLKHPCGPDQVGLQATVVPVMDLRNLNVNWPIPDLHPYYKSNPGHYLGHLIGHEGPGSLLSELKNRGWVNTLVGGQKAGAKGFMFFIVNVDLTEEGIEHTDDIVTLIFQYLNMLKKEGPQEWVFKECQDLSAMGFRFKDKERPRNYTCSCAGLMREFPMDELLSGPYTMSEYRPDHINTVLEKLVPETIRIAVIGQKFKGQTDSVEEWYGTDYSVTKISQEKIKMWQNAGLHENLKLPARNEFIPTNFQLVPRDEEATPLPQVIRDTSMVRLWFKQDDKYLLPKACINIEFTSPYAYMDPLCTNLTYIFISLFRDALNEYAYEAELAGLHYDLHSTIYGLTLNLRGYNDKQHVLLQKIVDKMTSFQIDTQRFDILKESYIRGLKNFKAEQPHQHAIYYTTVLTAEQLWTKEELLDATDEMTVEKLESFIPQLLSRLCLELLIYGNVTKEKANELADIVEKTLESKTKTKPLFASQQRRFREVQLPDGCCYVYKKTNDIHKSSSLEVYYQCNMQATVSNMLLELFCQIIGEPCFDILRTQEQLGYIVMAGVRRSNGVQGLRVIVQSDKSPEYVESRVEAFLHKMESHISDMSQEVFDKHIEALATRRLEKPKRLSAQNVKYWSEIISRQYNFDRDEIEVGHLRKLKKEDILSFYKELIAHDAPRRHKLSVHVVSGASRPEEDVQQQQQQQLQSQSPDGVTSNGSSSSVDGLICPADIKEATEITDVSQFKRCLGLFPLPKPYINVAAAKSKL